MCCKLCKNNKFHSGSQICCQYTRAVLLCTFGDAGMIHSGMYIIVSDLHIGSRHFKDAAVIAFLRAVPDHATLVLNGDTLDGSISGDLSGLAREVIQLLNDIHNRIDIKILEGNHDSDLQGMIPGIQCGRTMVINELLHVSHGDDFDNVMPRNRPFVLLFRWLHRLRVLMGATPIHVAQYAKRWRRFYRFLRKNVMLNAVEHAKELKLDAITCGHVHFPEDRIVEGVRYLNTGCWTEEEFYYLRVDGKDIRLIRYYPGDEVS